MKKKPAISKNTNSKNHNIAKIKIIGVGGGGGNAISRMRKDFIKGIDFLAINTDSQDLDCCDASQKIYIGKNLTRGLGTGMNPDLGRQAAEESRAEIAEALKGTDMVFITAGLGGGTGSGVSPVVAEVAKELGILAVAVVTKPFSFEGEQRNRIAQDALLKLREKVDTFIVIPNDRIFSIINKDTSLIKAFEAIDDILRFAVQGIAELIAMPGIINVDFADVKAIMREAGPAIVGIGTASGQERAVNAISQAINSPLLENSIDGAKNVLFVVSGGRDLKMNEASDMAKIINGAADPSAKIIFGAYYDRKMKPGQIKVTFIATGFNGTLISKNFQSAPTLFNGIASQEIEKKADFNNAENNNENKTAVKKKTSEIWDIPTFLRKKKR